MGGKLVAGNDIAPKIRQEKSMLLMKRENIGVGAREAGLSSQTTQERVSPNRGCKRSEDWRL